MDIYLKNSLSKEKELFKPNQKGFISMYNCGPTVYNRSHIGNLRSYIFADTIRRAFEFNNYKVNQIINITDVGHLVSDADDGEDKVEKQAAESGEKADQIIDKYTKIFILDLESLNINTSKITFPKATEHIAEQIELIKKLEEKGFTYKISDGIYFDTTKDSDYGKLGSISIDNTDDQSRIGINSEKKNQNDFALWKFSPENSERQQEWDSPWGVGFPGWHIECSAMSCKYLGENFDIHTGGVDHLSIHHNNEIAQSECANNKPLSNYWLHHEHIMIDGQKMSKSLGNVLYLNDLEDKGISPAIFRYWMLSSHYSTLINFTDESVNAAKTAFEKIIKYFKDVDTTPGIFENIFGKKISKKYITKVTQKINDDLNTAEVIATIWNIIKDDKINRKIKLNTILKIDEILGLNLKEEIENIQNDYTKEDSIPDNVLELAERRNQARNEKRYDESDELRDQIYELGYEIKDTDSGFEIKKARD
jgi:cysteinyl-tRNA synthetase